MSLRLQLFSIPSAFTTFCITLSYLQIYSKNISLKDVNLKIIYLGLKKKFIVIDYFCDYSTTD